MAPDEGVGQEFFIEELTLDETAEQPTCTECNGPCCLSAAESDVFSEEER